MPEYHENENFTDTLDALHAMWADANYLANDSVVLTQDEKEAFDELTSTIDVVLARIEKS